MGRFQAQKVNPELKQYFLINDFSGGVNTLDTDERMYDNEFRRLINVDLSEAGVLKRRKGWGLGNFIGANNLTLPDNIFLFTLIEDKHNNSSKVLVGETIAQYDFSILVGYVNSTTPYSLSFKKLSITNSGNNSVDIDQTYSLVSPISYNKLSSIKTINYLDKIYFMLNEINSNVKGMGVYDIENNKLFFIDGVLSPTEIMEGNTPTGLYIPYKPLPVELSINIAGYNVIANDPLTYFSGTSNTGIRGFYITELESNTKFLNGIPSHGKFRLNVLLSGSWSKTYFETVFKRGNVLQETFRYPIVDQADPDNTYAGYNFEYTYSSGFDGDGTITGFGVARYDITISTDNQNWARNSDVSVNLESFVSDAVPYASFGTLNDMQDAYNWFSTRGSIGQGFLLTQNGAAFDSSQPQQLIYIKKNQFHALPISVDVNTTATSYPTSDGVYYRPVINKDKIFFIFGGYGFFETLIQKNDDTGSVQTYSDFIWDSASAMFNSESGYIYPKADGASSYKIGANSPFTYYSISFLGNLLSYTYLQSNDFSFSYTDNNYPKIDVTGIIHEVKNLWQGDYANKIKMAKIEDYLILYAGNSLIWSSIGNFTYFPNTNYKVLPLAIDDEITSIQFFRGAHLIFTKKTIWRVSGDLGDINTLAFTLINDAIGCIAPDSVRSFENTVVFLSADGLYRVKQAYYQGGLENVEKIDNQLKGYLKIDDTAESLLFADQYWLIYKGNTDYDIIKYYYNIPTRYGHPYTVDKLAKFPNLISSFSNGVYAIKANTLYVYNSGYYDMVRDPLDNGDLALSTYNVEIMTGGLSFGYPTHDKKFKQLYFNIVTTSGDPLTVVNYYNGVTATEYSAYTITVGPSGSLVYDDLSDDPNVIGREATLAAVQEVPTLPSTGDTISDEFKVGFSILGGANVPLLHKLTMSGKAKFVSLYIKQDHPSQFALKDLGYLFKIGKVKEAR